MMRLACLALVSVLFLSSARPAGAEDFTYRDGAEALQNRKFGRATYIFRTLSKKENPKAMLALGLMKLKGLGTPKDKSDGLDLVKKAGKAGNAEAAYMLGDMYDTGMYVDENRFEAFEWLLKSAESGNLDAMFRVAGKYADGEGTDPDPEKAFEWYKKAAMQGHKQGVVAVAAAYAAGTGVKKDIRTAYMWTVFAIVLEADGAKALKKELIPYMTPADRAAAEQMAAEWLDARMK